MQEIPTVIQLLTQSIPSLQETTLERYFTQNASFVHPFCRVPSFEGSRWWVLKIFQWYKVMSPRIEMEIHSIGVYLIFCSLRVAPPSVNSDLAFDEKNLKLYVHMSQIFSIWVVPFHVAPVTLTTVLDLTTDADVFHVCKIHRHGGNDMTRLLRVSTHPSHGSRVQGWVRVRDSTREMERGPRGVSR